jgi:thiol-disulfide isomerase/thioredoxin
MAAVFFFSAYSKIYKQEALDAFQWSFLDIGISNNFLSAVLARLMIGVEFLLGLFLVFHVYLKKFTYPAIIALLAVFIVYLLLLLHYQGNEGNCGCFGNIITMKPVAAIWKNVAMICVSLLLLYLYPIKPFRNQEYVAALLALFALATPFIINTVDSNEPKVVNEYKDLAPLYAQATQPSVDLRKGKHIVAFMSLGCPHCRKAAYLLGRIHEHNPDLPIFFVLYGAKEAQEDFFKETRSREVPHFLFTNGRSFSDIAGGGVPALFWINNSVVQRKATYYQLDPKLMRDWLK